jgi:hypothetical protein
MGAWGMGSMQFVQSLLDPCRVVLIASKLNLPSSRLSNLSISSYVDACTARVDLGTRGFCIIGRVHVRFVPKYSYGRIYAKYGVRSTVFDDLPLAPARNYSPIQREKFLLSLSPLKFEPNALPCQL